MIIEEGSIVWAKAGRDKGKFFVVLKADKHYCFIADGKTRKLMAPKKKNRIHLSGTNQKFNLSCFKNDCNLAKALTKFEMN